MVTLRRETNSGTRKRDYDYDRRYRDEDYAYTARINERESDSVSSEYLDYLWAELNRTEKRRTLRPEEFLGGERREEISRRPLKDTMRSYENVRRSNDTHAYRSNSIIGKLDKRGVVAIVAYFLIVAAIATLIIVNGAGGRTFDPATGSQAEISIGAGNEVNPTVVLPIISDESLGVMVLHDGSAIDINLIEKTDAYAYQPKTNWFDKMCDTLSFIAGG